MMMARPATIPFADSPLQSRFQHMDSSEFDSICQSYDQLWNQEGIWPRIDFPVPQPFKRLAPKMYLCLSWSRGVRLMEEGTVDENDLRALQPLVPIGTRNRLLQFIMVANSGFLSRFLTDHGVPFQYPHLVELAQYFSFTMPPGQQHDAMRAIYAAPVTRDKIKQFDYEGTLAFGAGRYLDSLRLRGSLTTDIALTVGRRTVVAAMAELLGVQGSLLDTIINLARGMDNLTILRPSHQQLQEAEDMLSQACALIEETSKNKEIRSDRILAREYERLVERGPYTLAQWAYIATMLIRVSMENQIDSLNLVLRRFATLSPQERTAVRSREGLKQFVHSTLRVDPPVGFIIRKLPRAYALQTPIPLKQLCLPAGSFVVFVPRLLQSPVMSDNCGDYLLSFGYGRNQVCPGRAQGLLTVEVCARQILLERGWDIELDGEPQLLVDNAFFRRITSAPGRVTTLTIKPAT
jgi:cytochrome P450